MDVLSYLQFCAGPDASTLLWNLQWSLEKTQRVKIIKKRTINCVTSFSVLITLPRSCSSNPFIVTVKSIIAVRALT